MLSTGEAALAEANAIIERLGLGDDDANPSEAADLVSLIEGDEDGPVEEGKDATSQDDTATGEKPEASAESSTAASEKTGEADAAASKTEEQSGEQQPAGVMLRDGKHFLPYEKHVEERRLRMEAEARAKRYEEELAELRKGKADPVEGDSGNETSGRPDIDARIAQLRTKADEAEARAKEYETEGLVTMAQAQRDIAEGLRFSLEQAEAYKADRAVIEQIKQRESEQQTRQQQTVQEQVAEAIEHNPKLRYLQDTMEKEPANAELWDMIADQDKVLRANPRFASMSFADRFAKAVQMVEAVQGPIKLPTQYQSVTDIKAAAQAEAQKAGDFRPNTLSDLPGGGMPRGGGNQLGDLDPTQLERLMWDADDDKLAQMLAQSES